MKDRVMFRPDAPAGGDHAGHRASRRERPSRPKVVKALSNEGWVMTTANGCRKTTNEVTRDMASLLSDADGC